MNDTTHWCDDKDGLIEYLYGDLDAESRKVFEGHLRTCAACADDVDGLQSVRADLEAWMPPAADLGVTVAPPSLHALASPAANVLHPQWTLAQMPVWARAAAAVLVVGTGLGLANVDVRYGADGFNVSTGWMTRPAAQVPAGAASAPQAAAAPATDTEWKPELAALEADLRKEMQLLRSSPSAAVPATVPVVTRGGAVDDQAILRRVQSLIQESERRQQQALALRLTQFGTDIERQRRTDLVRLEQGFDRFQGRSVAASARQQEVLNLLVRASTTKVP